MRLPTCLFLALTLAATMSSIGAADFLDEFKDVQRWRGSNPKAPAEFSTDGDILTLIDPPGGEVTWGTSIARDVGEIDLDATPFFIAKVVEATGEFSVTLINKRSNDKSSGPDSTSRLARATAKSRPPGGYSVAGRYGPGRRRAS